MKGLAKMLIDAKFLSVNNLINLDFVAKLHSVL